MLIWPSETSPAKELWREWDRTLRFEVRTDPLRLNVELASTTISLTSCFPNFEVFSLAKNEFLRRFWDFCDWVYEPCRVNYFEGLFQNYTNVCYDYNLPDSIVDWMNLLEVFWTWSAFSNAEAALSNTFRFFRTLSTFVSNKDLQNCPILGSQSTASSSGVQLVNHAFVNKSYSNIFWLLGTLTFNSA